MADDEELNRKFVKACSAGRLEQVRHLVEVCGVSPDVMVGGFSGLTWAVMSERSDVLQYLIDQKANINTENHSDRLMFLATEAQSPECLRILAKAGADIEGDVHGMTYLIRAAWKGQVSHVTALVEAGANVFAQVNRSGALWTAREYAEETRRVRADMFESEHDEVVRILRQAEQLQIERAYEAALIEDAERSYDIEQARTKEALKQAPPFKFKRGG